MLAAVINTPQRINSAGCANCENAIPNAEIAAAAPQMIHLRSNRSAKLAASRGAIGYANAMMKEYCRLLVTVMPFSTSSAGTQLAKPYTPKAWQRLKIMNKATSDKYGGLNSSAHPACVAAPADSRSAALCGRAEVGPAEV